MDIKDGTTKLTFKYYQEQQPQLILFMRLHCMDRMLNCSRRMVNRYLLRSKYILQNPKFYNIYYIEEMATYYSHGVSFSEGQRLKLAKAYQNNSAITIRLTKNGLNGSDELMLTKKN